MGYVIIKAKRTAEVDGKLRVISNAEQWYLHEARDFHSKYGVIKKEAFAKGSARLGNEEFLIVPGTFADEMGNIKRHAQIITPKDIGFLIGFCGLHKGSVVVESGAGSGGATCVLAKVCKKVHSYEISDEHLAVAQENVRRLGCTNVTFTKADFTVPKDVRAHTADLVLLDLPQPWDAYDSAIKACRPGGFIIAYTPSVIQAARFVNNLPESIFHHRTMELIDRDWKIHGDAVRPINTEIGHTAFLTITRRVR